MSEIDTEQFKKIIKAIRIAEVAGITVTFTPSECAYLYSCLDNLNAEIGQMETDLARRDEIIARLKEAGENLIQLANFNNKKATEYTDVWCALMKELEG